MKYCWLIFSLLFSYVVNAQEPRLIIPKGHTGLVSGVFTPNKKQLLCFGDDLNPTIWDVTSAKELGFLNYTERIIEAFFLDDKKTLVTISSKAQVVYWNWENKKKLITLEQAPKQWFSCKINESKTVIAILSDDGLINVIDIKSKSKLSSIKIDQKRGQQITDFIVSPNGSYIAVGKLNETITIFETSQGRQIKLIDSTDSEGMFFLTNKSLYANNKIYSQKNFNKVENAGFYFSGNKFKKINDSIIICGKWSAVFRNQLSRDLDIVNIKSKRQFTITETKDIIDFAVLSNNKIITITDDGIVSFYDSSANILNVIEDLESIGLNKKIITSNDGSTAAILNNDIIGSFRLIILDSKSMNPRAFSTKVANTVTDVLISPDAGKIILNEEYFLKYWDKESNKIMTLANTKELLDYSKDEIKQKFYLEGDRAGSKTREVTHIYPNWMNNSVMTASGGRMNSFDTIKIWGVSEKKENGNIYTTPEKSMTFFRPNENNNETFIAFDDSSFCITTNNILDRNTIFESVGKRIDAVKFFPDNERLWLVADDTLFLYNRVNKQVEKIIPNDYKTNEYFILSNSCKVMLRDDGTVMNLDSDEILFKLDKIEIAGWKSFSKNDSLIAYEAKNNTLNLFDINNRKIIYTFQISDGAIESIAFSQNNKFLCISKSNRTVTLYNLLNKKEIATFVLFDNENAITLLPTKYYMTSSQAALQLHYVKNNRIITFEQLDIKYNRPDKVLEAIGSTDTLLINSYKKAYQKRIKKLGIDTTQFRDGYSVPESDFINRDAIEYEQTKDKLILKIKGFDSTYKLNRFNVWINEVPLFGLRGIKTKQKNNFDTTITINLSQGENRIETSITNVNGTESYRMPLFVKYTPVLQKESKTHFIGIGINQFSNSEYNLSWSVKDIRDLAIKLKSKYPNIIIDTLFDKNVTKENILALKQKLLQLNEDDKVIVSYSGHGVLSKDFDYYLSTYSINFNKPEEKGLAYDDLESLLDNIKPRQKLMLIDACHSGEVDKEELDRIEASKKVLDSSGIVHKSSIKVVKKKNLGMANSFELMQSLFVNVGKGTGATIISAAGGMQYAQERGDLKNGVFTYSIIEAMNNNSTLKVSELKRLVGERVTQLTNGLQKPTSRNETNNYDWVIW